jgi:hypothetical protein
MSQINANIEYGTIRACYDFVVGSRSALKMEATNRSSINSQASVDLLDMWVETVVFEFLPAE